MDIYNLTKEILNFYLQYQSDLYTWAQTTLLPIKDYASPYISASTAWIKHNVGKIISNGIGPGIGAFSGAFFAMWFERKREQRNKIATINGIIGLLWVYLSSLGDMKTQFSTPLSDEVEIRKIEVYLKSIAGGGEVSIQTIEEILKIVKEKKLEGLIDIAHGTNEVTFKFECYQRRLEEPPFDFNFSIEKLCNFNANNSKVIIWLEQTRRSLFKLNKIIHERNDKIDTLNYVAVQKNETDHIRKYAEIMLDIYNSSFPKLVNDSFFTVNRALFFLRELGEKELPKRLHRKIVKHYFENPIYQDLVDEFNNESGRTTEPATPEKN